MNTFEPEVHLSQDVSYHAPMLVSQINFVFYFSYHMVHLICKKALRNGKYTFDLQFKILWFNLKQSDKNNAEDSLRIWLNLKINLFGWMRNIYCNEMACTLTKKNIRIWATQSTVFFSSSYAWGNSAYVPRSQLKVRKV